jgi:hypothetical protein
MGSLGEHYYFNIRGGEINKCPNCAGFLFAFEERKIGV